MATTEQSTAAPNGVSDSVPDFTVKSGLAQMLKGGVIMDVVNAEQVCLFSYLKSQCVIGKGMKCERRGRIDS